MSALRVWWSAAIDYDWVVSYHRTHSVLRAAPYLIASTCALIAVVGALSLASSRGEVAPYASWVFICVAVLSTTIGLWWLRGQMPTRTQSRCFVAVGDSSIAAMLLSLPPSPISIALGMLFAPMGNYTNVFHGPRAFAVHHVLSMGVVLVLFVRAIVSEPEETLTAITTSIAVTVVLFAASPLNHFFFDTLRQDAARAYFDHLTGLRNRRGLFAAVHELLQPPKTGESPNSCCVSAICIDLDSFKAVNDQFGHATGDDVLRETAGRIRRLCGDQAVGARLGGEEFVVVLVSEPDRASQLARALLVAIYDVSDRAPVSASIGVASAPIQDFESDVDMPGTVRALIDVADDAMYEAKRRGGNRIAHAP
ncbi:MAG: GGDEF domain-containing protein [Rhodococcus sp. (in: high G+C Gram-positive bacteria)]